MTMRNDLLTVSIGAENVATIKAVAARKGLPVSRLVRNWIAASLADKEARNDHAA